MWIPLFASGHSIEEIATWFAVRPTTVIGHLCTWLAAGHALDPDRVRSASNLAPADQARVLAAIAELGPDRLAPIFEALGGEISYEELRIMRLYYLAGGRAEGSFSNTRK
ncbi:MAG: helix-turn-helix domain-containing protein [Anaerolineae bacterium]